jgi:hypothetical protein
MNEIAGSSAMRTIIAPTALFLSEKSSMINKSINYGNPYVKVFLTTMG